MNTLAVITESVFKKSGDSLSGEIWLDICAASSGSELRVALLGTERCTQWADDDNTPVRQSEKSVVEPPCDILLFESDTVFRYGCYIIPFQVDLPKKLPGSFKCARSGYEMCIQYHLHAYAKNDPILSDKVELHIEQNELYAQRNGVTKVSIKDCEVNQIAFAKFAKVPLHMETSLEKTVFNRDDAVLVGVKIVYMPKFCKIVKRQLVLSQEINIDLSASHQAIDENSNALKVVQSIITVLRTKDISEEDAACCNIEMKLRPNGRKLAWGRAEASTDSSIIKCRYFISLFVQMDRDQKFYTDRQEIFIRSDVSSTSVEFSNHNKLSQLRQLNQYEDAIRLDYSFA